jgi:TPP-dependent pyruvate/acetoin dehydrogenase alpha subunit
MINVEFLQKFEKEIATIYESGVIKAPIHLRDGNEAQLIKIFKNINSQDYVFSTWASHSHALLKGVDPQRVKKDILEGRSITLNYPKFNFYSSAIVGGVAPIALGVAKALAYQSDEKGGRVYCFVGDMSFQTGIVNESIRYSLGHDLPITWIVEDNKKSVGTDTENTCGILTLDLYNSMVELREKCGCKNADLLYYSYINTYPHSGTGVFVEF